MRGKRYSSRWCRWDLAFRTITSYRVRLNCSGSDYGCLLSSETKKLKYFIRFHLNFSPMARPHQRYTFPAAVLCRVTRDRDERRGLTIPSLDLQKRAHTYSSARTLPKVQILRRQSHHCSGSLSRFTIPWKAALYTIRPDFLDLFDRQRLLETDRSRSSHWYGPNA